MVDLLQFLWCGHNTLCHSLYCIIRYACTLYNINITLTENVVIYTISGTRTDFTIAVAKFAAISDNSMIAKVSSSDSRGATIGS